MYYESAFFAKVWMISFNAALEYQTAKTFPVNLDF